MWIRKMALAALVYTMAHQAQANIGLRLGEPGYNGSGCPTGTASVTLSPDETELSILFNQYSAESGGFTGRRVDQKSCNLAIPVHVPQGFSVSIFKVDYRGFISVPSGGLARLSAEYFFAGGRGPRITRTFNGSYTSDYTVTDRLQATALVWSACGDSVNLRVNSSMMTQTNRNGDQAFATVDSVDISNGIVYHVQWKRCF